MFGLDERIASLSDGTTLLVVVLVSVVLGLRHASDPDHLAAVTTLVASGKERAARRAGALGFAWGLGHATSLFAFGLFGLVALNIRQALDKLEDRVEIRAFVADGTPPEDVAQCVPWSKLPVALIQ